MTKPMMVTLAVALLLAGCGDDDASRATGAGSPTPAAPATAVPTPSVTFDTAPVIIDTGDDSVLVTAEVAEKPEQHARGLMFRESLEDDRGMVFLFFEEHHGGFWMKNTPIPLSIAFFDVDGNILRILDMDPCTEEPCEVYDPGVGYYGALEVNQGSFERWGVTEGDKIVVSR